MRSPAVTTRGAEDETYEAFTARVAEDQARVNAKCAALDPIVPYCHACGETCDQAESGTNCRLNNIQMRSRWARELAQREWYRLGRFGGSWSTEVENLAVLLDLVCAGVHAPERDAK